MVARFADALPPKWSSFIELLKHTGSLDTVSIYEFIQKLEHKNDEEIRKAKRTHAPQNTEIYLPGFSSLASSSSSSAQQPKLQTAFMSNPSSFPFPHSAPPPVFDPSAYLPPAHVVAQAHAFSKPQYNLSAYIPTQPQAQSQPQQANYSDTFHSQNPNTVKLILPIFQKSV
ncbi:hypothetical protein HanLR1_Chr09g0301751 [Helianthus annuus]|nr:hypothetical protein HanHA89_Chr09g0322061 [Helianthus annuus]KAJ0705991.1 hypothetical protein HanLR1_Chr09g0301751 [Helianthus annuus]